MARKKRQSDELYNARRRFSRAAERYTKKYEQAKDSVTKSRFAFMARNAFEKAMNTYANVKQKVSSRLQRVAQTLGLSGDKQDYNHNISQDISRTIEESKRYLDNASKDEKAKSMFSVGNVASRFYGSLTDVWEGSELDADTAIKQHFGVDSLLDVIEIFERHGINLFEAPESYEQYQVTMLDIKANVL